MFKIKFLEKAFINFQKIDLAHQKIIKEKLIILSKNPKVFKNNIKKLAGINDNLYRLRVGSYRVIFKRENQILTIIIIRIGNRKDIYLKKII